MSEEQLQALTTPLPSDGIKSRRFFGGAGAFLVLLGAMVAIFIHSGMQDEIYFDQTHFIYGVLVAAVVLLVCFGLLSVSQVLEVIKLKIVGAPKVKA